MFKMLTSSSNMNLSCSGFFSSTYFNPYDNYKNVFLLKKIKLNENFLSILSKFLIKIISIVNFIKIIVIKVD